MPRYVKPRLNLAGHVFGKLIVLQYSNQNSLKRSMWRCQCVCGKRCTIAGSNLVSGNSRSCGCSQGSLPTHGAAGSRTYRIWTGMKQRCTNRGNPAYKNYGGRGIKICSRWLNSYRHFVADMGVAPDNLTLDRFPNNNGNYEPGNCRWATRAQQAANRRRAVALENFSDQELKREARRRGWSIQCTILEA